MVLFSPAFHPNCQGILSPIQLMDSNLHHIQDAESLPEMVAVPYFRNGLLRKPARVAKARLHCLCVVSILGASLLRIEDLAPMTQSAARSPFE